MKSKTLLDLNNLYMYVSISSIKAQHEFIPAMNRPTPSPSHLSHYSFCGQNGNRAKLPEKQRLVCAKWKLITMQKKRERKTHKDGEARAEGHTNIANGKWW